MENNKKINLKKNFLKRKFFLKNELKMKILKTIINNKNCKPIFRILAKYKFSKITKKSFISKQNNNICLKSGKIKSILNITNYSRHYTKKLLNDNTLQNFKVCSW